MFHGMKSPSEALAKIAHLTSVFEKLVAEAGLRRGQIEQRLVEISEEREDVKVLSPPLAQRAA